MTLPNFLIIGAAKSGTMALSNFLKQHPQVNMPYKEPDFFSGWGTRVHFGGPVTDHSMHKNYRRFFSLAEYQSLYSNQENKSIHVDASISYLIDHHAAENIFEATPNTKLLAILRQPVDRAYSHFIMYIREGWEKENDFLEFVKDEPKRLRNNWHPSRCYMEISHYPEQLKRYTKLFNSTQLKIKLYEDWNDHPQLFWNELIEFLEIDSGFTPDFTERINVSRIKTKKYEVAIKLNHLIKWFMPQHLRIALRRKVEPALYNIPKLDKALRNELTEKYFKNDILQLQDLIDRDLSHWL